jgi:hypothetical protein
MCSFDSSTAWSHQSFRATASKASAAIVNAWQACVTSFGTKNWVEVKTPDRFVLRLSKRKEYSTESDKIRVKSVAVQSDASVSCQPNLPTKPVNDTAFAYNCKRSDATKDVVVTFKVDGLLKDLPVLHVPGISRIPEYAAADGTEHTFEHKWSATATVGPFSDGHRWIQITKLEGRALTWIDPAHTPWVTAQAAIGGKVICSAYADKPGGTNGYIHAIVDPAKCGPIFLPRNATVQIVASSGNLKADSAGAYLTLRYKDPQP